MGGIDLSEAAPKVVGSFDRTVPLTETAGHIQHLRTRFRIDRIADLTLLDRSKIPVFSAIVARSLDTISVYNGKGPTTLHASVGAVMEAVERQAATSVELPLIYLRDGGGSDDAIDARELGALPEALHQKLPYVRGYDISASCPRLVPLAAVQTPWHGTPTFASMSSGGLAAGNTVIEAVYHALFELVEGHLFSLAQARGHAVPRLIIGRLTGSHHGSWVNNMVDDGVGKAIERPTGDATIDALCDRIESADIALRTVAYEEPPLPVLVVATVAQRQANNDRVHLGLGCSWSPRHALLRALTEAMQSRVSDTSGGREDITPADDSLCGEISAARRTKRLPKGRWYFDATKEALALSAISDRATVDIATDVCILLSALRNANINRVVVVDITPRGCPVKVVRVVAPEIETAFEDGRVGPTIAKILAAV